MELHLIRHGQTNWNKERRSQGQSDSVLTDLGIQQAKQLGQKIEEIDFDAIYCSSSVRTKQTAEHAFSSRPKLHNTIIYKDSLREIFLGPWEGVLYDDIEKEDPESYQHFWQKPHLFSVDGAESFYDLQTRAVSQINELAKDHLGKTVALVSHGALIKSVLCHAENRPIEELWAPPAMHNCAHSIIGYDENGVATILQYADEPVP
ncbi:MAG: histidine phosphatase family protein [Pseudohongiellaceae bacterium]